MYKTLINLFCTLIFSFSLMSSYAEDPDWPEPTNESKPWTRWWWPNNGVDKENISRELKEFATMGIGGVEITPIYGVKGAESKDIEFLSPAFSEILKYTITEANKLGMEVDLPPGSGWRCGGPFVPEEKGLWNIKIKKISLKAGEVWKLENETGNVASACFVGKNGNSQIVNIELPFTAEKKGSLYLAFRRKSTNKVKRPSKGGEGWAIDTFNKDITNWYLSEFWERLGIDDGALRCFFHDSFEYTGDFTSDFLIEFENRRGYKLDKYLYALDKNCRNKELVARVKSDYRQTLADLVLESFIQPMTDWANQHKSLNRNQAHGSPGNILDLYAACDIPETEIFSRLTVERPDVFVNKFASSAANVTGQKLVSSESYTWLEEHWTVTTSDLIKATNRFFLAGVNHMFFHGTCYSPADDKWPGWLFYASTQINNRNPLWREMPTLFKYIERVQTVMQASTANNDLLIYWPYFDVAAEKGKIFNHIGVNKDAGWFNDHPIAPLSEKLEMAGYTFDFISDKQLLDCKIEKGEIITSGKTAYKAVVIPKTEYIPLTTMHQLVEFISNGGKVFFDEHLPSSVPGVFQLGRREEELKALKAKVKSSLWVGNVFELLTKNGVRGEPDLSEKGFHHLKMKHQNEDWLLVFNITKETKDEWVTLSGSAKNYVILDPMNGEITKADSEKNSLRIQLEPEQIIFVRCAQQEVEVPDFTYVDSSKAKDVGALWKVVFLDGGPIYPGNLQMDDLVSWTKLGDQEAERFAGTVKYTTEFQWEGEGKRALLDLGQVNDCARVKLNGKDFGALLGPVFNVKVDNLVKGKNKLEVEVTNVAANRIRDLDRRGVVWRKFYDINLVNIDYKAFDASDWEVKEAGLLGPVKIYSN